MKKTTSADPTWDQYTRADGSSVMQTTKGASPQVWRKRKPRTRGLCSGCFYFGERDLTCRRKAPHLTYGTWPNVRPDDWCGDYMKYQAPD